MVKLLGKRGIRVSRFFDGCRSIQISLSNKIVLLPIKLMLPIAAIEYIAIIGLVLIGTLFVARNGYLIYHYLGERKRQREFSKFEDVISGKTDDSEAAKKYFQGDVKLIQEVYVFIPTPMGDKERLKLQNPIDLALKEAGLGEVVRGYETGDSCGFDVHLNDFVRGVDLLRKQLVNREAPAGTLIEYSGGDLPIYED